MKRALIFIVFSLVMSLAMAQPPTPPPAGPPTGGGPGNGGRPAPLGGIELLIAAGAAFGAKKWFDKNKKK